VEIPIEDLRRVGNKEKVAVGSFNLGEGDGAERDPKKGRGGEHI